MEPVHFHGSLTKGTKSEVATSPLSSRGPKEGGIAMQTLHSRGFPTKVDKIKNGYLTITFFGAENRAELLCNPCILGGPQRRGTKSEVASSPLHSQGAHHGGALLRTPCILGSPQQKEQNQKWLRHPCLLGGPQEGGLFFIK